MLDSTVEFWYFICTGYNTMQASLGTKLDEHTVLTHNHFGNQANYCMIDPIEPTRPHDVAIKSAAVAMGYDDDYGNQTQSVHISEAMTGPYAPIASQQDMEALLMGEFVEVVYRDDTSSELAIASLHIRELLGNSVLVLDDPQGIIDAGDSGGGVYYQGALIGNTWRYLLTFDQDNLIIDKQIHVHLLPREIETHRDGTD